MNKLEFRVWYNLNPKNSFNKSIWFDHVIDVKTFIGHLIINNDFYPNFLQIKIEEKLIL